MSVHKNAGFLVTRLVPGTHTNTHVEMLLTSTLMYPCLGLLKDVHLLNRVASLRQPRLEGLGLTLTEFKTTRFLHQGPKPGRHSANAQSHLTR
jgi:hypothetical protein